MLELGDCDITRVVHESSSPHSFGSFSKRAELKFDKARLDYSRLVNVNQKNKNKAAKMFIKHIQCHYIRENEYWNRQGRVKGWEKDPENYATISPYKIMTVRQRPAHPGSSPNWDYSCGCSQLIVRDNHQAKLNDNCMIDLSCFTPCTILVAGSCKSIFFGNREVGSGLEQDQIPQPKKEEKKFAPLQVS